ncbi:MAG TPA: glucose-6-phosphate dehydrogenase, partial [Bacteroidales bacterium]|nr:glucose-6-phosphate dehydrogenase [Bacteroidales bacterium]
HSTPPDKSKDFLHLCYYIQSEFQSYTSLELFVEQLYEIDIKIQTKGNFIFYLSTPPSLYEPIVTGLGKAKLNISSERFPGWKRLIVEKPFGKDVASAHKLQQHLISHFDEEQIYRIDHYLGKETAQNILVTRFYNTIFEPLWNRNYIHHVEITSAEQEGIGNRGGYYDGSGALRDMLQNHLLQLVALTAMEPPTNFNADSIRNEVLKVFQSLRPLNLDNLKRQVVRGQYTQSHIDGILKKAYTEELDIPANSRTETYVALKFFIDNWRWGGVPFFIRTGKNLPTRVTEIVITFKSIPHPVFVKTASTQESKNQLIIRIQPDEGIAFRFGVKIPGIGFDVETTNMNFKYAQKEGIELPSAYERLLHDCMQGDASLFTRGDAVDLA